MELRHYILILKKNFRFFIISLIILTLLASAWAIFRPKSYTSILSMHIARNAEQTSQEYQYDDFYRLQADERFADTVVRWLASPRVVLDIYESAHINVPNQLQKGLSKIFSAKRLSSQFIEVRYTTAHPKVSEQLSESISLVLNKKTRALNPEQSDTTWFKIIVDKPVIQSNDVNWALFLPITISCAAMAGFWIVLIRHYIREETNSHETKRDKD